MCHINSMQQAFSTSKRSTDENICPLRISIRFWPPRAEGKTFHWGLECGWISSPLIALLHPVSCHKHGRFLMVTSAASAAHSSSLFSSSLSIQSTLIFSQEIHCSVYSPHSQRSLITLIVVDTLSQSCSAQFYICWCGLRIKSYQTAFVISTFVKQFLCH